MKESKLVHLFDHFPDLVIMQVPALPYYLISYITDIYCSTFYAISLNTCVLCGVRSELSAGWSL